MSVRTSILAATTAVSAVAALFVGVATAVADPAEAPAAASLTDPAGPPYAAPTGPGELARTVIYSCDVVAGGLPFGIRDLAVRASAIYPEAVSGGDVLPARTADLRLTLPETVRQAVYDLLVARSFEASSAGSTWSLTSTAGTTTTAGGGVVVPRSSIPEVAGQSWTFPGSVTIPQLAVPEDPQGGLWLGLPEALELTGTFLSRDGTPIPATFKCDAPVDRVLGGIAVEGWTYPPPTGPTEPPVTSTPPTTATPPTTSPTPDTPPTTPPPTTPPPVGDPEENPYEPGSPPATSPGLLGRSFPYVCRIVVGGIELGTRLVDVEASVESDLAAVRPDGQYGLEPVQLRLTPDELVRSAVIEIIRGRSFEGAAEEATWTFRSGGAVAPLVAPGPRFAPAEIPQGAGQSWVLASSVRLPELRLPGADAETAWLQVPERLVVDGVIVDTSNSPIPTALRCLAPEDRRLGGFAIDRSPSSPIPTTPPVTTPTAPPPTSPTTPVPTTPVPTTETYPTPPATTAPTAPPTTAPTTAPPALLTPTVKAGALGLRRAAVFTVGVQAKGVVPTGTVVVKRGDTTVAKGRLVLGVTLLVADDLPKGEHTFTITYSGDAKVAPATVTKKVRIL